MNFRADRKAEQSCLQKGEVRSERKKVDSISKEEVLRKMKFI